MVNEFKRLSIQTHFKVLVTIALISVLPLPSSAKVIDSKKVIGRSAALIKAKRYNEAVALLESAVKNKPKHSALQYYLGLSYIYSGNTKAAELPLSKAIVVSNPRSAVNKKAIDLVYKYRRIKPYSCLKPYLKPPQLVRWSRKKMPLLIYVSDGKVLPRVYDDEFLSVDETKKLGNWAKQPQFVHRLQKAKLYKPAHRRAVIAGIQKWQWASQERLIDFKFTNKPGQADVLVFWSDVMNKYTGFTYHPPVFRGKAYPCVIFMSLLKTRGSDNKYCCNKLKTIMTHEFGHVFGLEHSTSKDNLMFPTGASGEFSNSDKATMRALYSMPADVILPSVSQHSRK